MKKEFSEEIHNTDSSQSSLDELALNAFQFTASCFYTKRI